MERPSGRMAIHVVTEGGAAIARRIQLALGEEGVDVYYVARRVAPPSGITHGCWRPVAGSLKDSWRENFARYRCHVPVFSLGAAVRLMAPLLQDKRSDPAVVAVDELGRFAIALLSGHLGRANDWTRLLAGILDATPVITTASDLIDTLQVDLLGRHLGWRVDPATAGRLTEVAGLVVARRPVAVVQLAGSSRFWPSHHPLPAGVSYHTHYDGPARSTAAALLVSDLADPLLAQEGNATAAEHPIVMYRPPTLVVGIGCDRGFPVEAMQQNLIAALGAANLATLSVRMIASLDLKADEPCLVELARRLAVPFHTFSAAKLETVSGTMCPSARVKRLVGTASVAEAAALLGAQGAATLTDDTPALAGEASSSLLLAKRIFGDAASGKNMTIAVARRLYGKSPWTAGGGAH